MVASIRYWLRAFNVCKEGKPTWLGDYLFEEANGKDRYIEDLATLWLLHFCIVFFNEATLYNMIVCVFPGWEMTIVGGNKFYTTFL